MAVAGIANHGQRQVNPLVEQWQEKRSEAGASGRENAGNKAVTEDTFTPSTQNDSAQATAQAAGIFQISQAAQTTNTVLAQPVPDANQNAVPAQDTPATTTNAVAAQVGAAAITNASADAAQQVAATPAAQAATDAGGATTNVQGQVQALNTALAALGLSNYDIEQIDRIAAVIQNFNPSAYTDLVNQFQELAQELTQQSAVTAAANASTAASPITAANTGAGTNANGGSFQVQSVSINFTGVQETVNSAATNGGGQGTAANNAQITTANLQIEQVQFTLTNANGQAIQVQAPQQNTHTGTTYQQTPPTQSAAA
jgi:hypothetical protein